MTTLEKNVAIALMMGAVIEQWYPPNKDTGGTGQYLSFPERLYNVTDEKGEIKPYKWYPDFVRQHGDYALKFHKDANWQLEALEYIRKLGYKWNVMYNMIVILKPTQKRFHEVPVRLEYNGNVKDAIFETLYLFSQYLKNEIQT